MLLAMSFVVVSLVSIGIFHNQVRTMLRLTENDKVANGSLTPLHQGMARALELIRTGTPPDGYVCSVSTPSAAAVYTLLNGDEWRVTVSTDPYTVETATCTCPSSFADTAKLWDSCQ